MENTKRLTVTVGVPSHNEYDNLLELIPSILQQRRNSFVLSKIIIASDNSNDKTSELPKKFPKNIIKFILSEERLGKPARINQIFKLAETDIVVILDADVKFSSKKVLDNLVSHHLRVNSLMVSGLVKPFAPKSFVQKVANAGIQISELAREITKNSELYFIDGSIRSFDKKIYSKLKFPDTSADEAFSYLACKLNNWNIEISKDSIVKNYLPTTWGDYVLQQRRYLISEKVQNSHFSEDFVNKYYTLGFSQRIKAAFLNMFKNPLYTIFYLVFIFFIKISLLVSKENSSSKWTILKTTKNINNE